MLKYIGIELEELFIVYCDSTSIIYHVLREKEIEKEIRLEYVTSKDQIAKIFMKPFPTNTFECFRGRLGVVPLPTSKQVMQ